MAINPRVRLYDSAGHVRTASGAPRPAKLRPDLVDAANAAVEAALVSRPVDSPPPIGRMKPPHTAHAARRVSKWERIRRGHLFLGTLVLIIALSAATAGIVFATSPGITDDPAAKSPNDGDMFAPLVAMPEATATATAPATESPAATDSAVPTLVPTESSPTAAAIVASATSGPGMPALAPGFHDTWLVADGQDCQAAVGEYRPQELVENANPGLNTGARCGNLRPGTILCRDGVDRAITGTPPCLGAIRVASGIIITWGMIPGATPGTASVSLGTRSDSDLTLQPDPVAAVAITAPHGACFVPIGPTSGNTAVVQLTGATAVEVDLAVVASTDVTVAPC